MWRRGTKDVHRPRAPTVSDKAMRPGRVAMLYKSAQSCPFHTFQPSTTSAGSWASESVYRQHCSPSISGPKLQLCPSCQRKFFAAPGTSSLCAKTCSRSSAYIHVGYGSVSKQRWDATYGSVEICADAPALHSIHRWDMAALRSGQCEQATCGSAGTTCVTIHPVFSTSASARPSQPKARHTDRPSHAPQQTRLGSPAPARSATPSTTTGASGHYRYLSANNPATHGNRQGQVVKWQSGQWHTTGHSAHRPSPSGRTGLPCSSGAAVYRP